MTVPTARFIFHEGRIVPFDEARVQVLSVGMAYATTVFEGLRAYWNEAVGQLYVFRLEDHARRLLQSMKLLRLEHDLTDEIIQQAVLALLRANELREDAHIRQLVYGEGIGPITTAGPVGMTVAAMPSYRLFDVESGIACATSSWRRIGDDALPPRIKCTANYQNARHAMLQAKLDGYGGALLLNGQGKVTEGPTMCVFLVRDGKIITPSLTSGVLESITRSTVIELLSVKHGVEVEERPVDRTEFYVADEAFFCGTACEVLPIVSLDRYPIGNGKPGPLTRTIQKAYNEVVRGMTSDDGQWRTPVYKSGQKRPR